MSQQLRVTGEVELFVFASHSSNVHVQICSLQKSVQICFGWDWFRHLSLVIVFIVFRVLEVRADSADNVVSPGVGVRVEEQLLSPTVLAALSWPALTSSLSALQNVLQIGTHLHRLLAGFDGLFGRFDVELELHSLLFSLGPGGPRD